jgi:hypothetical protein
MEGAEDDERPSNDIGRPPPIVQTTEANLLSLHKNLKTVVTEEFFRNTTSGTWITTKSMAD